MIHEQEARDLLERMGIENAQSFSAGKLVELSNLIAELKYVKKLYRPFNNNSSPITKRNANDPT